MRSLLTQLIDALFPPSTSLRRVRAATYEALSTHASLRSAYGAHALLPYRTPLVRALIHEAKFHRNEHAIALLGQLLAAHLAPHPHSSVHVVPLPLARERLRERGYNQVLEIAKAACACAPHIVIHDNLLTKVRHTSPQTSLSRAGRLTNLAGAFAVTPGTPPPETYLVLLDDILTTGSTFAAAKQALVNAGYRYVECLALAH